MSGLNNFYNQLLDMGLEHSYDTISWVYSHCQCNDEVALDFFFTHTPAEIENLRALVEDEDFSGKKKKDKKQSQQPHFPNFPPNDSFIAPKSKKIKNKKSPAFTPAPIPQSAPAPSNIHTSAPSTTLASPVAPSSPTSAKSTTAQFSWGRPPSTQPPPSSLITPAPTPTAISPAPSPAAHAPKTVPPPPKSAWSTPLSKPAPIVNTAPPTPTPALPRDANQSIRDSNDYTLAQRLDRDIFSTPQKTQAATQTPRATPAKSHKQLRYERDRESMCVDLYALLSEQFTSSHRSLDLPAVYRHFDDFTLLIRHAHYTDVNENENKYSNNYAGHAQLSSIISNKNYLAPRNSLIPEGPIDDPSIPLVDAIRAPNYFHADRKTNNITREVYRAQEMDYYDDGATGRGAHGRANDEREEQARITHKIKAIEVNLTKIMLLIHQYNHDHVKTSEYMDGKLNKSEIVLRDDLLPPIEVSPGLTQRYNIEKVQVSEYYQHLYQKILKNREMKAQKSNNHSFNDDDEEVDEIKTKKYKNMTSSDNSPQRSDNNPSFSIIDPNSSSPRSFVISPEMDHYIMQNTSHLNYLVLFSLDELYSYVISQYADDDHDDCSIAKSKSTLSKKARTEKQKRDAILSIPFSTNTQICFDHIPSIKSDKTIVISLDTLSSPSQQPQQEDYHNIILDEYLTLLGKYDYEITFLRSFLDLPPHLFSNILSYLNPIEISILLLYIYQQNASLIDELNQLYSKQYFHYKGMIINNFNAIYSKCEIYLTPFVNNAANIPSSPNTPLKTPEEVDQTIKNNANVRKTIINLNRYEALVHCKLDNIDLLYKRFEAFYNSIGILYSHIFSSIAHILSAEYTTLSMNASYLNNITAGQFALYYQAMHQQQSSGDKKANLVSSSTLSKQQITFIESWLKDKYFPLPYSLKLLYYNNNNYSNNDLQELKLYFKPTLTLHYAQLFPNIVELELNGSIQRDLDNVLLLCDMLSSSPPSHQLSSKQQIIRSMCIIKKLTLVNLPLNDAQCWLELGKSLMLLPTLEELVIEHCNINDIAISFLQPLFDKNRLKSLTIKKAPKLTDTGFSALLMSNIEELNVSKCSLLSGNAFFKCIAQKSKPVLKSTEKIHTDPFIESSHHVAPTEQEHSVSPINNGMKKLYISNCVGIEFITLYSSTLTSLSVHNSMTRNIIIISPTITALDLSGNSPLKSLSIYAPALSSLNLSQSPVLSSFSANATHFHINDVILPFISQQLYSSSTIAANHHEHEDILAFDEETTTATNTSGITTPYNEYILPHAFQIQNINPTAISLPLLFLLAKNVLYDSALYNVLHNQHQTAKSFNIGADVLDSSINPQYVDSTPLVTISTIAQTITIPTLASYNMSLSSNSIPTLQDIVLENKEIILTSAKYKNLMKLTKKYKESHGQDLHKLYQILAILQDKNTTQKDKHKSKPRRRIRYFHATPQSFSPQSSLSTNPSTTSNTNTDENNDMVNLLFNYQDGSDIDSDNEWWNEEDPMATVIQQQFADPNARLLAATAQFNAQGNLLANTAHGIPHSRTNLNGAHNTSFSVFRAKEYPKLWEVKCHVNLLLPAIYALTIKSINTLIAVWYNHFILLTYPHNIVALYSSSTTATSLAIQQKKDKSSHQRNLVLEAFFPRKQLQYSLLYDYNNADQWRNAVEMAGGTTEDPFGFVDEEELYDDDDDKLGLSSHIFREKNDVDEMFSTLSRKHGVKQLFGEEDRNQQDIDETIADDENNYNNVNSTEIIDFNANLVMLSTFLKQCQTDIYDCCLPSLQYLDITDCPKITAKHVQHFITSSNTLSMLFQKKDPTSTSTTTTAGPLTRINNSHNDENDENDNNMEGALTIVGYKAKPKESNFVGRYLLIPPKENLTKEQNFVMGKGCAQTLPNQNKNTDGLKNNQQNKKNNTKKSKNTKQIDNESQQPSQENRQQRLHDHEFHSTSEYIAYKQAFSFLDDQTVSILPQPTTSIAIPKNITRTIMKNSNVCSSDELMKLLFDDI